VAGGVSPLVPAVPLSRPERAIFISVPLSLIEGLAATVHLVSNQWGLAPVLGLAVGGMRGGAGVGSAGSSRGRPPASRARVSGP
jgi:hypothetical protein